MPSQTRPTSIIRQRIQHFPISNTELNYERLPEPEALRDMALQFREEFSSKADRRRVVESAVVAFAVLAGGFGIFTLLGPALLLPVLAWIRSIEGLPIVAGMICALILFGVATAVLALPPPEIRAPLLTVGLTTFFLATVNWVLGPGVALLASMGALVCLMFAVGLRPWEFYSEWLLTHFRLRPEQVEQARANCSRPNQAIPVLIFAVSVLSPAPVGAIGLVVLLALNFSTRAIEASMEVLSEYLTYSGERTESPGVWVPKHSLKSRIILACAIASLVLLAGLFAVLRMEVSTSATAMLMLLWLPLSFLVLSCLFRPTLVEIEGLRARITEDVERDDRTWWHCVTDRLRSSEHSAPDPVTGWPIKESDHIFLGVEPLLQIPILLHRSLLDLHVYIVGRTGSGKTSIGLMQILLAVIWGFGKPTEENKSPIVILDFKGDRVMFHVAHREAARRGQPFRFFTLEKGVSTHFYNPFVGFYGPNRSLPQLVQLVIDSLDLNHGTGYGRGYFSQRARYLLSKVVATAQPADFPALYKALIAYGRIDKTAVYDAFELIAVIEALTHYPQLVTSPQQQVTEPEHLIEMDRVLEERQIVYFWLPSALESVSVKEVGKLVLFNLRTASHDRQRAGLEQRKVYLFIDECQKVVGENFRDILQTARSFGIAAILANQSLNDLDTPSFDLRSTFRTNTAVKMYFSLSEPEEIKNFITFSGMELKTVGEEEREQLGPRLTANEIALTSDHPQRLFLQVHAGAGYSQFCGLPVPVQTDWPIAYEEVKKLEAEPWPDIQRRPVPAPVPPPFPKSIPTPPAQVRNAPPPRKKVKPKAAAAAGAGTGHTPSQTQPNLSPPPAPQTPASSGGSPPSSGASPTPSPGAPSPTGQSASSRSNAPAWPVAPSTPPPQTPPGSLPVSSQSPAEVDEEVMENANQKHLSSIQSFFEEE